MQKLNINWFPGHMAKTLRQLREQSNACDYVVETCDARIPNASRNPELSAIAPHKQHLLLLNKEDLADAKITQYWCEKLATEKQRVISCNTRSKESLARLRRLILEDNQEMIERAKAKGRRIKPIRVMVVGIPNTGKSTLINALTGKNRLQTANRPGVTKSLSWLRAGNDFELLDSPGTLWPKLETVHEQIGLAATGAIKDDVVPLEQTGALILLWLMQLYPSLLSKRYGIELKESYKELLSQSSSISDEFLWQVANQLLAEVARSFGFLQVGGNFDLYRAAKQVVTDLRLGKIGRISLEQEKLVCLPR